MGSKNREKMNLRTIEFAIKKLQNNSHKIEFSKNVAKDAVQRNVLI